MTSSSGERRDGPAAGGAPNRAGGSPVPGDTPMTGIYIAVVIVEAIIIAALWALGRIYS
jgi:hypothetical protein